MKKFLAALFLFLAFTLTKVPITKADCVQPQGRPNCIGTRISCYDPGGTLYCCFTNAECTSLVGGHSNEPDPPPPPTTNASSSNPLNGGCIDTALGCIPVEDTNEFMGWILGWAIGVGGGIAFLLIVYASFMITTSQGAPERLKAGQELLTSAISGLIMLVFSVFILKFIGVDILGLDQFGFN